MYIWISLFCIINIFLTILLVILAKITFDLNHQNYIENKSILEAKKYQIALDSRNFITNYLKNSIEFIAREKVKAVKLSKEFADIDINEDTEIDVLLYWQAKDLIEHNFYSYNYFHDIKGDSVKKYYKDYPTLNLVVQNILDKEEYILYKNLQQAIDICNYRLNIFIDRMKLNEIWTSKYYSEIYLKREKRNDKAFNLSDNLFRNSKLNRLRDFIIDVKEIGFLFLESLSESEISLPKFICKIESDYIWNEQSLGEIKPKKNATIFLDSMNYSFDYYKYFIENKDSTDTLNLHNKGLTTYTEN